MRGSREHRTREPEVGVCKGGRAQPTQAQPTQAQPAFDHTPGLASAVGSTRQPQPVSEKWLFQIMSEIFCPVRLSDTD